MPIGHKIVNIQYLLLLPLVVLLDLVEARAEGRVQVPAGPGAHDCVMTAWMTAWMKGATRMADPVRSEPALILGLDRTDMRTPDGVLHGGAVISFHQQTIATVSLGSGEHTLSVLAAVTDVDGEPGLLDVHLEGSGATDAASAPRRNLYTTVTLRFAALACPS